MKWELLKNGDWQAKGDLGDFLLWKHGRRWKGRYMSRKGTKRFELPHGPLKKLKEICEDNYYWELSVENGK